MHETMPNGGFKTSLDPRCLLHKHNTDGFKSPITGRTHKIVGNTSFRTDNVIYFISCKVCSKQYIGKTDDLRRRINNHRSSCKINSSGNFNMSGHKWEDMTLVSSKLNSSLKLSTAPL